MQRRKFLFDLVRAAAALTVAPAVLTQDEPAVVLADFQHDPVRRSYYKMFKVTSHLLAEGNQDLFDMFCEEYGIPDVKPDKVEVGCIDDDFIRDLYTVKLTYYQ